MPEHRDPCHKDPDSATLFKKAAPNSNPQIHMSLNYKNMYLPPKTLFLLFATNRRNPRRAHESLAELLEDPLLPLLEAPRSSGKTPRFLGLAVGGSIVLGGLKA